MSDDGAARRETTRGTWMHGPGARDGFGSPPWGPADPVPELRDTQELPGLGQARGRGQGARAPRASGASRAPAQAGPGTKQDPPADPAGRDTDGGRGSGREGKRRRSFWRELPVLVVAALVLALVIKSFAVQAFYIPSGSMEDTLDIGDRVLINKVVYHLRPVDRGDIVVFDGTGSWDFDDQPGGFNLIGKAVDELEGLVGVSNDSSIYIKRVIGLPGDHVACCTSGGQVTVNGVPLSEGSYLYPGNRPSAQKFSITVPQGRLWVMGDHRLVSYDSRGHLGDPGGGTIPESAVLGRAFVRIWPPDRWGVLDIPATFEQPQLNAASAAANVAAAAPLALGFAGALPLTWLQRRARRRRSRLRRSRETANRSS